MIRSRRSSAFLAGRLLAIWLGVACLLLAGNPAVAGETLNARATPFTLATLQGGKDGLAQHAGEVVMINFWASWCEPCRTEFPLIENLYKRYSKLGFTVLAVNIEPDTANARKFLAKTPVSFPILLDADNKVSDAWKVDAMPTTLLIDRKGHIRYLHRGYDPGDEQDYEKHLRALLRE